MARIEVITEPGVPVAEPFLLRLAEWTEKRYFAEAPEDRIWEFRDGELIVQSPARPRHQDMVGFVTVLLRVFGEEQRLGRTFNGPAALRLRDGVVKEPDIFFVATARAENITATRIEGPADLVIEVISAETRTYDLVEKARVYQEGGVQEYWAVDADRQAVIVYRAPEWHAMTYEHGALASSAVPGFWIEVHWLWQDPLPASLPCLQRILSGDRP